MTIGDVLGAGFCACALAAGCWLAWLVLDSSRVDQLKPSPEPPPLRCTCSCDGDVATLHIETENEGEE